MGLRRRWNAWRHEVVAPGTRFEIVLALSTFDPVVLSDGFGVRMAVIEGGRLQVTMGDEWSVTTIESLEASGVRPHEPFKVSFGRSPTHTMLHIRPLHDSPGERA